LKLPIQSNIIVDINTKYPIKDHRWSYSHLTKRWATEASDFKGQQPTDPWKRAFPAGRGRELRNHEENEVEGWVYNTTVAGVEVECVVFND
jgi:hypothetical protein